MGSDFFGHEAEVSHNPAIFGYNEMCIRDRRLVVGGLERVYEVGRIFRNEGMDTRHNPEFTSVEMYQAYTDYHGMMDFIEELYKYVAMKVCGTTDVPYQGETIHLGGEWARMTMKEAVKKYTGVDFDSWASDEEARAACKAEMCIRDRHPRARERGCR